jgi:energy-coupling factor transporter ATP-binding protein EcfA2
MGRGRPRKGGPLIGMPGTGKTTYLRALEKIMKARGKGALFIRAKDCSEGYAEIVVPQRTVLQHISGILQFTASDGFKASFDRLRFVECNNGNFNVDCLIEYVGKKYREDIADWVLPRLLALKQYVFEEKVRIPTCLKDEDELVRRLVVGILYAIRPYFALPIILDDMLSFVVNETYRESFIAMGRPFKVSVNRYLESRDILNFNPTVITPGGAGGIYRFARPDKYVVIFDDKKWELPRREIEKIAYS